MILINLNHVRLCTYADGFVFILPFLVPFNFYNLVRGPHRPPRRGARAGGADQQHPPGPSPTLHHTRGDIQLWRGHAHQDSA